MSSRALQQTDRQALKVLLACWATEKCAAPAAAIESVLEALRSRYPRSDKMQLLHYDYLRASEAPRQQRIAFLEAAVAPLPSDPRLYHSLIREYLEVGDRGGIYETVASLMRMDSHRWQLPVYQVLFQPQVGEEP